MPTLRLTRNALDRQALPVGDEAVYYFDDALPGFGVRVSPKGRKVFVVQGRVGTEKVRKTIGPYPAISPEDARRRAASILSAMAEGIAPDRAVDLVSTTDALRRWLAEHVATKLKPRTGIDYRRLVEKTLIPRIGNRPVKAVTREELAAIHHAKRETPREANHLIAVAKSFFSWAEDSGLRPRETNPARRIRAYPENRRERFLGVDELARVAEAIEALETTRRISRHAAAGIRLCILTGARQGEIRILKWREVDIERRLLLLEDSKTGRKPIFLNRPAIEILNGLPRLAGNPHVIVGAKAGEAYNSLSRVWEKIREEAGLEDVRLHDLRHTFASFGAAESMSLPMIGRLLGHRVPATTARYAHLANDPALAANERIGERLTSAMSSREARVEVAAGGGSHREVSDVEK